MSGRASLGGYPVNLLVEGRRCVVVGGGRIAARKIEALLDAGADVRVVAVDLSPEVEVWRDEGRVAIAQRAFEPADLDDAWLVTTATDDPATNRAVADAAEARRVWCNAADDPANCTFTLMSVVRQGDLVVTIGTGGRSPALAAWLRRRIEAELGPELEVLLDLLAEARAEVTAAGRATEDLDWQRAFDEGILVLVREGRVAEARELLRSCL
jgi:siroheme synthase-like protein